MSLQKSRSGDVSSPAKFFPANFRAQANKLTPKILFFERCVIFFAGRHGPRFDDYRCGAQSEGWCFGRRRHPWSQSRAPPELGPRLRGATVGDATFGLDAEEYAKTKRCAGRSEGQAKNMRVFG